MTFKRRLIEPIPKDEDSIPNGEISETRIQVFYLSHCPSIELISIHNV
jgi:hypothetical protein